MVGRAADHRERYGERDRSKELRAHRETKTWGSMQRKHQACMKRDGQTGRGVGGRQTDTQRYGKETGRK